MRTLPTTPRRADAIALALSLALAGASAAAVPAPLPQPTPAPGDELPLAVYLDALGRLAPAARTGAEAYLAAHETRCGRALGVAALRRAVAEGDGEPTLMAMMRAAHAGDVDALQRLRAQVPCGTR